MKKFTKGNLLRYSAIALALSGVTTQVNAVCSYDSNTITLDNQTCNVNSTLVTDTSTKLTIASPNTTLANQGQIRVNTDLSGSDTALLLDDTLGLKFSVQIGRSNAVNIESSGTAIQFDGTNLRANTDGFNILNGSTVKGGNYAFYIPNLTDKNMRITITDGTVDGNIYINSSTTNTANHQIVIPDSGSATIRSSDIQGINTVTVNSNATLTIASGTTGSNWNSASLVAQDGSTLTFLLEDINLVDSTALLTTANTTLNTGSTLTLTLANGISGEDIANKELVLINATTKLTNNSNSVIIYDSDGNNLVQEGTEVNNPDEWLVTQQQQGKITFNTSTSNQLSISYDPTNAITLKDYDSAVKFLANTQYESNFVTYVLANSLGLSNERESILVANPSNAAAAKLSRQFLPDLSGADINAAWVWGEQMRSNMEDRLLAYQRQSPIYSYENKWNFWVNSSIGRGSNNNLYGYNLSRYGVHIGADRQLNNEGLLGLSVGVNHSHIDGKFSDINKKMTQLLFMPYFEWNGKPYFASANLLGGAYSVESKRAIADTTAKGDYTGFQFGYQLTGGINTEFKGIHFRPFVSLKEQWLQSEAWTEENSPFALAATTQKYKARHIGTGLSIWKEFELELGKFVPSLDIQYYKQMGNRNFHSQYKLADDSSQSVAYGDFNLDGITGNQFSTKLNARLDISENLNLSGALSYNHFGSYKEAMIGFSVSNTF
ncbi:uncharacterized protein with beta-barrel porin domain [Volucribacter psittacicida]|uniref:Uncharacterized protein with beta-barrel porin domain n=1 Tax=Volucribacter psittacicida TaxID=203482 RepID=A0A4R1FM19_9PAST|nr:autotransporter outer membrane beta-barrel domain-containing protein [Volucribacter psittacicida]TCJ95857.1 uncharacterized protein with beta-barrel porin domain [Volucribacter psittacicida]